MSLFEEDLKKLKARILEMGGLVESAIKDSVRALTDRDDQLAEAVIKRDHVINVLDVEIDEEAIKLIVRMQPKGSDLRFITTAMKITTDLERMGDICVNIAERALEINKEPILKPYIDIPRMRELAQGMTRDALDAFMNKDQRLATDVIMRDDEVDDLKYGIIEELLSLMMLDPSKVSRGMKISFVAQYLERIADHATNIAEMAIYLVVGKIIRHTAYAVEQNDKG
jgi:phosphate transport system protein